MMADSEHVRIEGLSQLATALKNLPIRIQNNGLRAAVFAGAAVIRDEAKKNAPVKTGTLKRAVIVARDRQRTTGPTQAMIVTVRKGKRYRRVGKTGKNLSQDAYYAPWVEYGTAKNAANPFLRPAWEAKKKDALDAMKGRLEKAITDAARQVRT